jgi:hypothetical protein
MTIGKRLLGVAVRNEEPLTPIAFSDAILRELPRLAFPILLFAQAIFGSLTPLPSLALLLLIVIICGRFGTGGDRRCTTSSPIPL